MDDAYSDFIAHARVAMAFRMIAEFLLGIFRDEVEMENREVFNHLRVQRRYIRDTSDLFTLPAEYFQSYYR